MLIFLIYEQKKLIEVFLFYHLKHQNLSKYLRLLAVRMPETMHVTKESCRICLEDGLKSFKDSVPLKRISYTELYQSLSGVTLVSTGPQRLCKGCGASLIQAYELKKKIEESEKLLLTLVDDVIAVVKGDSVPLIKEERVEGFDDDSMDFDFGTTVEADVDAVSVKIEPETFKSEESLEGFTDDDEVNGDSKGRHNLRKRPKKKAVVKVEKKRKIKRPKQELQPLSLECSICAQVFTKKFDFRNHYRVLHVGEEIQCPNCTRVFTNADEFDKHVRHGHKKRNREKTLCPHCAKVMLNTSIQEHIKSIHEQHHSEYICDLCGVRAKSKDILTGHMKFKHQNLTYNCRYCPEIFKNKGTRRTHEIRFHTFDYKHCWYVICTFLHLIKFPNCSKIIINKFSVTFVQRNL